MIDVVVGVVFDHHKKSVLMGSRPEGKPYAGYWEFPGGKIEPGETFAQALIREFQEELGITLGSIYPWFVTEQVYEHGHVRLHWARVESFTGRLQALEGQQFAWIPLQGQRPSPMLPQCERILQRATLPEIIAFVHEPGEPDALERFKRSHAQAIVNTGQKALQTLAEHAQVPLLHPGPEPWLMTQAEMASGDFCQQGLFGIAADESVLTPGTHCCPLYVRACGVQELETLRKMGAHGIALEC